MKDDELEGLFYAKPSQIAAAKLQIELDEEDNLPVPTSLRLLSEAQPKPSNSYQDQVDYASPMNRPVAQGPVVANPLDHYGSIDDVLLPRSPSPSAPGDANMIYYDARTSRLAPESTPQPDSYAVQLSDSLRQLRTIDWQRPEQIEDALHALTGDARRVILDHPGVDLTAKFSPVPNEPDHLNVEVDYSPAKALFRTPRVDRSRTDEVDTALKLLAGDARRLIETGAGLIAQITTVPDDDEFKISVEGVPPALPRPERHASSGPLHDHDLQPAATDDKLAKSPNEDRDNATGARGLLASLKRWGKSSR